MGLDLYFAEDIRNALLAANEGSAATAAAVAKTGVDVVTLRAYREGYKAALVTLALAFGIAPQTLRMEANYERAVECETGDGGILGAVVGDCSGIRPSDGRGTCADIGETNQRNGGERWIT